MDLDAIYKTRLPESHAAGLQAVYDAGLAQASAAFLAAAVPADAAPTTPQPTGALNANSATTSVSK